MPNILVVEDNQINMKLATLLLSGEGYTVLQAADGEAAITMARHYMPDLILMDVQMPGMDGLTAAGILKRDPSMASTPIIALTALAMRGDEERIRAAGCDGYIAKPFQYRDFLTRVRAALDAKCGASCQSAPDSREL